MGSESGYPKIGQPVVQVLKTHSERMRVTTLEQIFDSNLLKMTKIIGEKNLSAVTLQRLRVFLYLYVKRVGFRFFCEVMSDQDSILKFLRLTVERMKCAMSSSEPKRITSPSEVNFLIPRGGPDPSISNHHRRYQPYGHQPVRHYHVPHPTLDPFSFPGVLSPAVGESGRSPYHIDTASGYHLLEGSRSWAPPASLNIPSRIQCKEENIVFDMDSVQDVSSDLLEFLNDTTVLPELNFNTDLDFSVVRDDLDVMERCLFVRSGPSADSVSDYSSSNSPMSYYSQSPPTSRQFFSPNIPSEKLRRPSYSDSESSEVSCQIVPNITLEKAESFPLNIETDSCSNSPVHMPSDRFSPNHRLVNSPLSAHLGQLTMSAQELEPKLSVLRFADSKAQEEAPVSREPTPPTAQPTSKKSSSRRESGESSPPKKFLASRSLDEPKKESIELTLEEKQKAVFPLPFKTAKEEISSLLDPTKKEDCMRHVAKLPEKDLLQIDDDGDTQLMILVSSDDQLSYEQLYALVERLRHYPQSFLVRNKQGLTALFMAMWRNRPLVSGYLAETMSDLNLDICVTYKKGNTIFHYIALVGDDMAKLLAYLARVKKNGTKQAATFNVHNHNGRTPVHEAVIRHGVPSGGEEGRGTISCLKVIEIMCAYGANPGEGDRTSGRGAIHAAVEKRDLELIELMLQMSPLCANARMYNNNTPLHYAATLPNICEDEQFKIIRLLMERGADKALRNAQKKLPIELVCQEHQKVKMLLQARAKKQFRLLCSQQTRDSATSNPS